MYVQAAEEVQGFKSEHHHNPIITCYVVSNLTQVLDVLFEYIFTSSMRPQQGSWVEAGWSVACAG